MASLPVEILYGLYLGVLTGLVPALIAWLLGFGFKYFTGVTIPGLGVVALGVTIAGLNGGLLALADPSLTGSTNQLRLTIALLVVLMGTLYAHGQGDKMGAALPKRLSLRDLTKRTLSADVVELVGGRGQVEITVVGDVGDVEGYPPLPAALRESIREETWTFPADLPLVELESRVETALRTEYDLLEVSATLDERGRATVTAAPPTSGLSKHLRPGERAVSVDALVPTGAARGDEVTAFADGERFDARLLGVVEAEGESGEQTRETGDDGGPEPAADGGEETDPEVAGSEATVQRAVGGRARATLAASRQSAQALVAAEDVRLIVESRGSDASSNSWGCSVGPASGSVGSPSAPGVNWRARRSATSPFATNTAWSSSRSGATDPGRSSRAGRRLWKPATTSSSWAAKPTSTRSGR